MWPCMQALYKQMLRYKTNNKTWEPAVNAGIQNALKMLPWWAEAKGQHTFKRSKRLSYRTMQANKGTNTSKGSAPGISKGSVAF